MKLWTLYHFFFSIAVCWANLHRMVKHFETLDSVNLKVVTRIKRNTDESSSTQTRISFETLGRQFNMVLVPGCDVIRSDLKAKTIDKDGRTETFHVNPNNFYTGFLEDDTSVEIDAHYEDGILSSNINFPDETYVVEPAWRHPELSGNATMISYRRSDVNWEEILPIDPQTGNRTRMKDGIRLPPADPANSEEVYSLNTEEEGGESRQKRDASKKLCHIITVAEFTFFRDVGNSNRGITAAFIISTMQHINRYFKRTHWDDEYKDMEFLIDEMLIHTHFTERPDDHYNADRDWGYNEKLTAFSESRGLSRRCLGHLFTSYPFQDNVLGLAFIAPTALTDAGGICSVSAVIGGKFIIPRSSWSSAKNSRKEQVLSLQYELVVTHELGHNWGAEHDPLTYECGPFGQRGGKYIMWPYSVSGYEPNNKYFSPCSKRAVSTVLRVRTGICFKEHDHPKGLCGNGIVEAQEECDPGVLENKDDDPCCTLQCRLRRNAVCSDFQHHCCQNCQIANSSVKCIGRNELTCRGESYCNGINLECPSPPKLPDKTPCIDKGTCYDGVCRNYCEILGREQGKTLKPCLCYQNRSVLCRRCCAEKVGSKLGECNPTAELLEAGYACFLGYCKEGGVCAKVERKYVERLFSFLRGLTVNKLVAFMRLNIVGTIIVLSLVVWIPSCLVIGYLDRENARQQNRILSDESVDKLTRLQTVSFAPKRVSTSVRPPSLVPSSALQQLPVSKNNPPDR